MPTEPQVHDCWPSVITAGATLKVDRSFAEFSNQEWTYAVTLAGDFNLTLTGTADPANVGLFHVIAAPTDTAKLNPGGTPLPLQFVEMLAAINPPDSEKFVVGRGRLTVEPNLAALNDGDTLSFAQRTLRAIRAEIYNRLTGQQSIENYSVGGRSVSKIPLPQLQELEGQYQERCYREANPGRFSFPINTVFPANDSGPSPYTTGGMGRRFRP